MMTNPKVMVSSTVRDLPNHRKEILDACQRQSMQAIMMEYRHSSADEAIAASLGMVNQADIYLGIFAHRYGYIPDSPQNPNRISVTEMEYQRAVKRGIPRMIFVMGKDHPISIDDVEMGEGADKLKAFKARLEKENFVNYFNSAVELRAHAINSLSYYRERDTTGATLHYVSDIPPPPEAYIAHPYTLLQTHRLVGRRDELNLLTDWVAKPSAPVYNARILNVVAIGGMGKSALTWKWFNDDAPQEMKPLAGRLWWSFYESDAHFENFIIRALAYVTGQDRESIRHNVKPGEREDRLLQILDREPFLFVLDGLERILVAYDHTDIGRSYDSDAKLALAAEVRGIPQSAADTFFSEPKLRKCKDPRVGNFLLKLANIHNSRILISTRLYPAELQTVTLEYHPGSSAHFLVGLQDDDAVDLWRAFGVSGSRYELLQMFHRFENYPLLIRALAGEVARYRRSPSDFDAWQKANPGFNPFRNLTLVQVKSHVLEYALRELDEQVRNVLHTIGALQFPASYDDLVKLLVGDDKLYCSEKDLDTGLTELEDRGLIGWNRRENRYDMHPIVRNITWGTLPSDKKNRIYSTLAAHFRALPDRYTEWEQITSLDDLTHVIELYNALAGLGKYDEACFLFRNRLSDPILYRLGLLKYLIDLIKIILPNGYKSLSHLSNTGDRLYVLTVLEICYRLTGKPKKAGSLNRLQYSNASVNRDLSNMSVICSNLAHILRITGKIFEAKYSGLMALNLARRENYLYGESQCLGSLGLVFAATSAENFAKSALRRSLRIDTDSLGPQATGIDYAFLAQNAIWSGYYEVARGLANDAWSLAYDARYERDFIVAARLQGEATLGLGDLETADERLHHALTRARAVNLVEEELPALVALAELARRKGDLAAARERLDDVWDAAERGPYPLIHADALNVLAQIERDDTTLIPGPSSHRNSLRSPSGRGGENLDASVSGKGEHWDAAVKAATEAYRKAWCDGISADGQQCYAYWWGLQKAKAHLDALGAPYPAMPPFDPAAHEPIPEVEINPDDEFGGD